MMLYKKDLLSNKKFVISYMKTNKNASFFHSISQELQQDREVMLTATSFNPDLIQYLSWENLEEEKEFLLDVLSMNNLVCAYFRKELNDDKEFIVKVRELQSVNIKNEDLITQKYTINNKSFWYLCLDEEDINYINSLSENDINISLLTEDNVDNIIFSFNPFLPPFSSLTIEKKQAIIKEVVDRQQQQGQELSYLLTDEVKNLFKQINLGGN